MRKTLGTSLKIIKKDAKRLFPSDYKKEDRVKAYWKHFEIRNEYVKKSANELGLFFNYPEFGSLIIFLCEFKSYNVKWKTIAKMGRVAKKKGMLLEVKSIQLSPDGRQWKFI
jgi:hypothetical protein